MRERLLGLLPVGGSPLLLDLRPEALALHDGTAVLASAALPGAATAAPARDVGGEAREALAAAVRQLLAEPAAAARGRQPLVARVSAAFVRFMVLPWVPEIATEARWQALAASRFEQRFGEPVAGWRLRRVDAAPPAGRLVAALPEAIVAGLAAAAGRRLRAVRVDVLQRLRRLLDREPRFTGCAVDLLSPVATVVVLVDGCIVRVRQRHHGDLADLAATVFAEWLASGVPDREVALAVAEGSEAEGPAVVHGVAPPHAPMPAGPAAASAAAAPAAPATAARGPALAAALGAPRVVPWT